MSDYKDLAAIRRDYGTLCFNEEAAQQDPLEQFKTWFEQVLQSEKNDPTAMVLSTVDEHGKPDARVVLLKGIEQGHFIFYTNYDSTKAKHINHQPYVAVNFYWPECSRQVRVRGRVSKVSAEESDKYFTSRPVASQMSAIISHQSEAIADRSVLEKALEELQQNDASICRPEYWGGYRIIPEEFEFWQGRDNRLHDRIHYQLKDGQWVKRRLAP